MIYNKSKSLLRFARRLIKKIADNIVVHIEIITDYYIDIKRALELIFKRRIDNSRYGIPFKLILQINYEFNSNYIKRLQQAAVRNNQVIKSITDFHIERVNYLDFYIE